MRGLQRFKREGDNIQVVGLGYGPRVLVVAEHGDRMLWKVPGHSVWGGNYQPWKYWGTQYLAVELIQPGLADVRREEQPGARYRRVVAELRAWVEAGS